MSHLWFEGNISDAIQKSKKERKIFLVYVEGDNEDSRKMNDLYAQASTELSSLQVVAVRLEAKSQNCIMFAKLYPVMVVPSTFLIGHDGVPIDIIPCLTDIEQFKDKVKTSIEKNMSKFHNDGGSANVETRSQKEKTPNLSQSNVASSSQMSASSSRETPTQQEQKSDLPIEDKVVRAQQLLEALREKKAKEEQEREKEEEIKRRVEAKEMQKAKKMREDKEAMDIAKEREREKNEAKLAKAKVMAQIAADKAERKARQDALKSDSVTPQSGPTQVTASFSRSSSENAKIQFRLPDGSTLTQEFKSSDSLETARKFLISNSSLTTGFTLATTFPRRDFTDNDAHKTLQELSLSPTAVLLVVSSNARSNVLSRTWNSSLTNMLHTIFLTLISPITMLWAFISGFLPGARNDSTSPSTANADTTQKRDRGGPSGGPYNREGSMARLRTKKDKEDDNNTWNGNSTQQM